MNDKFKMWVCQKKTHNKWWTYEVDGNTVTTKYGRIGQKGQARSKTFPDSWDRDKFISSKTWEKTGKGYESVSKEKFDLLTLQAEIMGSGNKIEEMAVVLQDGELFCKVPNQAAYDPNLELGIMISFRLRDKHGATPVQILVFRGDDVLDLQFKRVLSMDAIRAKTKKLGFRPPRYWQGTFKKVDNSHPLFGMVEKLQEVLGSTL